MKADEAVGAQGAARAGGASRAGHARASGALAALALVALLLPAGPPARAGSPGAPARGVLPIAPPQRSFLLVDAPRRFAPGEPAHVRVQLRGGGKVRLALFRLREPAGAVGLAGRRQGVSVARTPLGSEAEALLAGDRDRGSRLVFEQARWVSMPAPRRARRVWEETEVYDSNEAQEDEVATYWVRTGRWSVKRVPVGRLRAGLYLLRIHAGPWASTALLSVGDMVLLARRGDGHDLLRVSDGDGRPLGGVRVTAQAGGEVLRRGRTRPDGTLRLPASDVPSVRFVAERGDDVAWTQVTHARLSPCDPRVYLATGRPLYRAGETVNVRGHVRGCDGSGDFVGLADEEVTVHAGAEAEGETFRTDDDGNFVAKLTAGRRGLTAVVRGEEQHRPLRIDDRRLPVRGLEVRVDRPFASSGQVLRVEVADSDGGWPRARDVVLETPAGRLVERIGPGAPAVFHVAVPATDAPAERFEMTASLADGRRVTMASAEVWVGRSPLLLELEAARARGRRGERFAVTLRATDLIGRDVGGTARLAVYGTDGNAPHGAPRWTGKVVLPDAGARALKLPLAGEGPWLLEARQNASRARLVVWARRRPPQLSERGPLAVSPRTSTVQPGSALAVDVRLPPGRGRAWLTLEQGSVWHERTLPRAPGRTVRARLPVPGRARGLAKVVVTHVAGGAVSTASASVEVATSREIALSTATDRRTYAEGETAKVSIRAHTTDGKPSDAVVSLWLADAGYWDMGDDDYPLPGEYLRLPGKMASAGDSTAPAGYGAEEGRVLPDATMKWNGQRVSGTTYRHAWGHYGRLARVDRAGALPAVARALAREAGLSGAWVCPELAQQTDEARLRARDLPWDLVAVKMADEIGSRAHVRDDVLRFACPGSGIGGTGLMSAGRGGGGAAMGMGAGRLGTIREERLEGTLRFVGLRRLGRDGELELEMELPAHPGRWRIEALAIRDDGGGARAHAIAHTERPLRLWSDLPPRLSPGDEAAGAVHLRAPSLSGETVTLEARVPLALQLEEPLPERVTLDDEGTARLPVRLKARDPGAAELVLRARGGPHADAIRTRVQVQPEATAHPVAMRALVGPERRSVRVPLPEPSEPATLRIAVGSELKRAIADALEGLREPRWHIPIMRIDRLASLRVLEEAAGHLSDAADRRRLTSAVRHAHASEAAALARLAAPGGGMGWWTALPDSARVTAEALHALGPRARQPEWRDAWDALRRRVEQGGLEGDEAAMVALALAASPREGDDEQGRALLEAAGRGRPDGLSRLLLATRAAKALGDDERAERFGEQLREALEQRLGRAAEPAPCRGPAWFLCYRRWGERAEVARAAATLLDLGDDARPLAVRALRWIADHGPVERWWIWGSAEADVLALTGPIMPDEGQHPEPLRVRIDGRRVPVRHGRFRVPEGARDVRVVFPAREGRLLRLRVDGTVHAAPPAHAAGNVRLARRFERDGGVHAVTVDVITPEAVPHAELTIPLPAGLELSGSAEPPAGARMALVDGALHLRFERLPAGRTHLRLPLLRVASGHFNAPPARLRGGRGERWALTAATTTAVP